MGAFNARWALLTPACDGRFVAEMGAFKGSMGAFGHLMGAFKMGGQWVLSTLDGRFLGSKRPLSVKSAHSSMSCL